MERQKWRANNAGTGGDENRVTLDGKDIDSSSAESCACCGAKQPRKNYFTFKGAMV
jgi:hypothetical protein